MWGEGFISGAVRYFFALLTFLSASLAADKPNFVVFLIDDLGATDLGCYGSKFYETPHLDQLAKDGMRFRTAYSACTVCSPTRAAMLTGKYPARLRITDWIAGHVRPNAPLQIPDWVKALPTDEWTVASGLRGAGYATCAIGKWHLSPGGPAAHGFDVAIADNGRGQPATYLAPFKNPNLSDGPDGEELTARCTSEAIKFISTNADKPFFVYLPHFAVHTPLGGKKEDIARFALKENPQGKPAYAAMIKAVDDSVGRIRAELEKLGLSEKTVLIFTGDNGGLELGKVTDNLGVRAGKGSAYEGGVRVPLIVRWPGVTKAGTETDIPAITPDIPATLAEAAGLEKRAFDGVSLMPVLGRGKFAERPLFWHYPHYHPGGATPYSAIREGDFRLVHFYEDERDELYHLASDPEEKEDLATKNVGKAKDLRAKLDRWLKETGAQLPTRK